MNTIQGASFYDILNRLVIGILSTLWIFSIPKLHFMDWFDYKYLDETLYIIFCFFVGIIISTLVHYIAEQNCTLFRGVLYTINENRISLIIQEYPEIKNCIDMTENTLRKDYIDMYLSVRKEGLIGNVPQMEALSAFLQNLTFISALYFFGGLIAIMVSCNCCELAPIPIISLILFILSIITRRRIEWQIYSSILESYNYIVTQPENYGN